MFITRASRNTSKRKGLFFALFVTFGLTVAYSTQAVAQEPCVRVHSQCYATVQAAVAASADGDTVRIPVGAFSGPVNVGKSINLVGAGASSTTLRGGGPVLTIGTFNAVSEPTVTVANLSITGGTTHSSPQSADQENVFAYGGGVLMPPSATFGGADVTLRDVVVHDNLAAPTEAGHFPECTKDYCRFAMAAGGGIAGWGSLTLIRSRVVHNVAAGVATDADGGGVFFQGSLTIRDSAIEHNRAIAKLPWGRFAEGGGVFVDGPTVTITGSSITRNRVSLTTDFPESRPDGVSIDTNANGGGVHTGNVANTSIRGTRIDGNSVVFDGPNKLWGAINAGLQVGTGSLVMGSSSVSHNKLSASVLDVDQYGPMGGAFEWDGVATVRHSRFVGNVSRVVSANGSAGATAAVAVLGILVQGTDPGHSILTDSTIAGNVSIAQAPHGAAKVFGAGLLVDSDLTLKRVSVHHNVGISEGTDGFAQGGGVWNGAVEPYFPLDPASSLSLDHSSIHSNVLLARDGLRQGGGVFTTVPISESATEIVSNVPDQCFGCSPTVLGTRSAPEQAPSQTHNRYISSRTSTMQRGILEGR